MKTVRLTLAKGLIVTLLFLSSCATPGLIFNQQAFDTDTAIKGKALDLIDKSTESYSAHSTEVDALKTEIDNAVAMEKSRGKSNTPTIQMWESIRKNESGTLYGYFDMWKSKDKMSTTFVEEVKPKIAQQFDILIGFESFKTKK